MSTIVATSTELPNDPDKDLTWRWVANGFAFVAIYMSYWEISQHLRHYNKPYLQKYVVRILFMVPIYVMNSFWAINSIEWMAIYFDTFRECYEAFVIYNFMEYLLNFLCYETDAEETIDSKPGVKYMFPLCFLGRCVGGRRFLSRCKLGILLYIIVRPITAFLALLFEFLHLYGEGLFQFDKYAYPYLLIINNIASTIAMYCLVIFYKAYKNELKPMKPWPKFLCIKLVVFFTFFQGVVILILIKIGFITRTFIPENDNHADIGRNLQDFLICCEMLLAAIAHRFVFSHKPFVDLAAVNDPFCFSLMKIFDPRDERNEIICPYCYLYSSDCFSRRRRRIESSNDENRPLIPFQLRDSEEQRNPLLMQSYETV